MDYCRNSIWEGNFVIPHILKPATKASAGKEVRDMKKLLVLVSILSIATVACDAFKDSYDHGGTTAVVGSGNKLPPGTSGAPAAGGLPDYASDATVCTPLEGVKIAKAEKPGSVVVSALNIAETGAEVAAKAEKIGAFTTKIILSVGDKETLSFILKQTGEKDFALCGVNYSGMKLKGGEITVDLFNDGADKDATKAVNAGTFKLEFVKDEAAANTAVSVMKDLAKAEGSGSEAVEGSYHAVGLAATEAKQ